MFGVIPDFSFPTKCQSGGDIVPRHKIPGTRLILDFDAKYCLLETSGPAASPCQPVFGVRAAVGFHSKGGSDEGSGPPYLLQALLGPRPVLNLYAKYGLVELVGTCNRCRFVSRSPQKPQPLLANLNPRIPNPDFGRKPPNSADSPAEKRGAVKLFYSPTSFCRDSKIRIFR